MNTLEVTATKTAQILCVGMGWFPATPGGLNRYVYDLVAHWAAGGDQVELCAAGLPVDSTTEVKLTNFSQPTTKLPLRLWQTKQRFKGRHLIRPDAINLHFALYGLPILNDLPPGVPVTCTFHGPWALESAQEGQRKLGTQLKHWMEQRVYHRCDRFIVLSQAFGDILTNAYGIAPEKIHVIPGGVNLQRFCPTLSRNEARVHLGWPQDRIVLFTPRRLVQRMGLGNLLKAIAMVRQQVPEVWLAIAGKGPQRTHLEGQAAALNLQNYVRFLGYLPDDILPIAYQAADLTVVPSESLEGFGLILTESLASGTPALSTPVGGMPEVLSPLCPDLVTAGIDAVALQERLVDLLQNIHRLPSRSTCRHYAEEHFNWDTIAQQVKAVLLT
jgi:glycosyltransferase involved in cell wall biosynthesis